MKQQEDGYIKNKKEAIRSVRKMILAKYATTLLILTMIPVLIFLLITNSGAAPEKWEQVEVTFSHFSEEKLGFDRGYSTVLNTKDDRQYVVPTRRLSVEELGKVLTPGDVCTITYSRTLSNGILIDMIEVLSCKGNTLLSREDAENWWQKERNEIIMFIWIAIVLEVVALVLIDRLWCKPEHKQINKLKADIHRRISKTTKSRMHEE